LAAIHLACREYVYTCSAFKLYWVNSKANAVEQEVANTQRKRTRIALKAKPNFGRKLNSNENKWSEYSIRKASTFVFPKFMRQKTVHF